MDDPDLDLKLRRIEELKQMLEVEERNSRLQSVKLGPSQRKFIEAALNPAYRTILLTSANQLGKSFALAYLIFSCVEGYCHALGRATPWRPPVKIAILVPDYDNHARKFLENYLWYFYDRDRVRIESTQQGGPRQLTFPNTSIVRFFTHDQDTYRLAGDTWHVVAVDEPAPRVHVIELQRGLSRYRGKTFMVMTPLSEPWIFDEVYTAAGNLGGERKDIFALTAFPDENLKSKGGHLEDADVLAFRNSLSEEEKEARIHGRWMHLLGRVYKSFDERVHIIDNDLALPEDRTHGVTIDPHDRLPFAISFWYVTRDGSIGIYDEWPRQPFEEMVSCDLTIDDYSAILAEENEKHSLFWKIMDPNFGRKKAVVTGFTIAEEFQLRGHAFQTDCIDDLTAGHRAVEEYLKWDKTKEFSPINQPKLFIHRNCHNHIKSFKNYIWDEYRGRTAEGKAPKQKPKEKFKHFCDTVRYTIMSRPQFVEPHVWVPRNQWHYRRGWE